MKQIILLIIVLFLVNTNAWAISAECDQNHHVDRNIVTGSERIMLPGGGSGPYSGYSWIALTVLDDGKIEFNPDDVRLKEMSEGLYELTTKSKLWSDKGRAVTCTVRI